MNFLCSIASLGFAGAGFAHAGAQETVREHNAWPVVVQHADDNGDITSWTAGGPFLFSKPGPESETIRGFRPFWVQSTNDQGKLRSAQCLYPLFTYAADDETYRWSLFEIINREGPRAVADKSPGMFNRYHAFDVWPFWFSRQTDEAESSYRALFPIAGTMKRRLGFDRLSWVLFPLFVQQEKLDAVTTSTPWPFVRVTRGAAHGFALWPLFGWKDRPGVSRQEFYLWPLGYNNTRQPAEGAPPGTAPTRHIGALPFYTRDSSPGLLNENYLWPFFGHTERTAPTHYHEKRYLWPFLVQGRGDEQYVNRWGPFYTHSIRKGYDKTWYLWPVYRHGEWTADGLVQKKDQVGIFLYWSLVQRSATNPDLAPASVKHLWPLYSAWDNGAGHRQFQFPSPLEVFFMGNEKMRNAWTPFFSLFRYDRRAPGETRASLLWNAVTWSRSEREGRAAFHLGPLLSIDREPQGGGFEIAGGLFGTRHESDGRSWRILWMHFSAKREAARRRTVNPSSYEKAQQHL